MKYSKYSFATFTFCILIFFICQNVSAQTISKADAKKAAFKNMVDSQHFIFVAQSAVPLSKGMKNLTTYYDVTVSKDKLNSYLPYFGTAYTASYNQTKSPLDFTSTNFSYSVSPSQKKKWDVLIKIKNKDESLQYTFTIFDNGSATLIVNSAFRQAITFYGFIKNK